MWNASCTSGSQAPASLTVATSIPTTENRDTNSLVRPQGRCFSTGMTANEPSGLTSSEELPFRFHCFSGSLISGTTGLKQREVQLLCLDFGKCSFPPQRIRLVGGGIVLSISRTPDSFGGDSPKYTISQESLDVTASPFLLNGQKDLTTESPTCLTARQPQSWNERKPKEEEKKPWSWPENSDEEMAWIEPVSLSDLPNPWGDMSPIDLEQTTMDSMTSTDDDSEESMILPRNWRNVQPRDVGTTTYT